MATAEQHAAAVCLLAPDARRRQDEAIMRNPCGSEWMLVKPGKIDAAQDIQRELNMRARVVRDCILYLDGEKKGVAGPVESGQRKHGGTGRAGGDAGKKNANQ